MSNANSLVVYDGPSMIDGKPIVVILTGLASSSANGKTGDLVQSFILRSDILSVYRAFKRGSYPLASSIDQVAALLRGRKLRLGTYGDPAAAPVGLWELLVSLSAGHVGYTHQWQAHGFDVRAWAPLVMASVDSSAEAAQASALGMRYFRVSIGVDKQPLEVSCPASAEAGRKAQCSDCMLCGGTSNNARSIVIADHAAGHDKRARVIPIVPLTRRERRELDVRDMQVMVDAIAA